MTPLKKLNPKTRKKFFSICFEMVAVMATVGTLFFWKTPWAYAQVRVENAQDIRDALQVYKFSKITSSVADLKIAVIDYNFKDYGLPVGKFPTNYLPDSTEYHSFVENDQAKPGTNHGFGMAQIVWTIFERNPYGPKFYLLNVAGISAFKKAADFIVENNIKIVLHAQTYDYGSNFDGVGPLTPHIKKVIESGAFWVNAVGDYRNANFFGDVKFHEPTGEIQFPVDAGGNNTLKFENLTDDHNITITLSWSDYSESSTYASRKDLDLFLFKSDGSQIEIPNRVQDGLEYGKVGPVFSREKVTLKLDQGIYSIRVKPKKAENFIKGDKFVVILDTDNKGSVRFLKDPFNQIVLSPNDIKETISVGDTSPFSSVARLLDGPEGTPGTVKPDFVMPFSQIKFSNGKTTQGTSNASALFAGILGRILLEKPGFNREQLMKYVSTLKPDPQGRSPKMLKLWQTPLL
jgi:hypothetical protein